MAVCDLHTPATLLKNATKNLLLHWEGVHETWRDVAAQRFEKDRIDPLPQQVRVMLDATARLAEVLQKAEQECR